MFRQPPYKNHHIPICSSSTVDIFSSKTQAILNQVPESQTKCLGVYMIEQILFVICQLHGADQR